MEEMATHYRRTAVHVLEISATHARCELSPLFAVGSAGVLVKSFALQGCHVLPCRLYKGSNASLVITVTASESIYTGW